MPKLILCITGLASSGKSFAAKLIAKNYRAAFVSSGDVVRDEVKRRGLPYTKASDEKVASWFHAGREHLIVKRAWNKVRKKRNKILVVEGFRSLNEVRLLKKLAKQKPIIIEVYAPLKTRAKRAAKRHRFKDHYLDFIRQRDRNERKRGVGTLIKHADYRIDNSGTKKQLEKNIDKLMKKLLKA